jgi:hypothetical protein
MQLTAQQQAYIMLTAALEKLHAQHFAQCDDVSDVLGDEVCDEEVEQAQVRGEALLDNVYALLQTRYNVQV